MRVTKLILVLLILPCTWLYGASEVKTTDTVQSREVLFPQYSAGIWFLDFKDLNNDLSSENYPGLRKNTYMARIGAGITIDKLKRISMGFEFILLRNWNHKDDKQTLLKGWQGLIVLNYKVLKKNNFRIRVCPGFGAKDYRLELNKEKPIVNNSFGSVLNNGGNLSSVRLQYASFEDPTISQTVGKIGMEAEYLTDWPGDLFRIGVKIEGGYLSSIPPKQNWYLNHPGSFQKTQVKQLATPSMSGFYLLPSLSFIWQ